MSYRESVTSLATGGEWRYDPGGIGHRRAREEPPEPDYLPYVYAVVTDPETKTEHDVPIAVMGYPVYEDEPDPLDQHDEGVRQEGYPHENARLCSLIPANIRAMREALACCRRAWPEDREAAVQALTAALAEVDSIDNLTDPGLARSTARASKPVDTGTAPSPSAWPSRSAASATSGFALGYERRLYNEGASGSYDLVPTGFPTQYVSKIPCASDPRPSTTRPPS